MTQKQLSRLVCKWQRILRLVDWTITATLVGPSDVDAETFGQSRICSGLKIAVIKILDPRFITDVNNSDAEQTLVHELIHVHFEAIFGAEASESKDIMYEQAIESVSRGLVEVERQ